MKIEAEFGRERSSLIKTLSEHLPVWTKENLKVSIRTASAALGNRAERIWNTSLQL
jgi:hypothetical protein